MIPNLLAEFVAAAANRAVSLLRNRINLNLSREEFRFSRISFSQFGEDLAIVRWLEESLSNVSPFYVDVGAFHPTHCSNTLLLYKKGWSGINIDLNHERIELFVKARTADINIVAALSNERKAMQYNEYYAAPSEDRLSDITGDIESLSFHGDRPSRTSTVITQTLDDVLSNVDWGTRAIGYLNIDCEDHDLNVLRGINLTVHQPAIITIEALSNAAAGHIEDYLAAQGYCLEEKLFKTLLFINPNFKKKPG